METSIKIERLNESAVNFTINAPDYGSVDACLSSQHRLTEFKSIGGSTDIRDFRFSHDLSDKECKVLSASLLRLLYQWVDGVDADSDSRAAA